MSKYRKIDTRILYDEKFRSLSDDGKLTFLLLLVHPNMTALGGMRASMATLAEDLDWSPERFGKGFAEPVSMGMAKYDERGRMVALPNFLKYNAPENPNVVKAWAGSVDLLPECDLKKDVISWAYDSLMGRPESFAEAFAKVLGKPLEKGLSNGMPNQEPEPKPEPEPKQEPEPIKNGALENKGNTREIEKNTPPPQKQTATISTTSATPSPSKASDASKYEEPFDPLPTPEEGRAFLAKWHVAPEFTETALHRLMAGRLTVSDIHGWRVPARGAA